jgi:hypothetical protein
MSIKVRIYAVGESLDYTPGSAVAAGAVIAIAGGAGIATSPIAANEKGALVIQGLAKGVKDSSDIAEGEQVGWDANGSPVGGVALSGALTSDPTKMDIVCGKASAAADASATEVVFLLNVAGKQAHVADAGAATAAALTGTLTGTANGAMVDVAATAGGCGGGSSPTATQVDAAIATAVATIVSGVNEEDKELQTQINALITDVGALRTKLNAALLALERAGLVKTS